MLAFAKNVEGRYVYVNEAYLTFCGLTREAVLGNTDYELFPPEIADVFVHNDRLVLQTGQTMDTEDLAPSGGEMRVGHCTKFALRDDTGSITGIGGIVVDITERHAARKALERSEARYRLLVEHTPDAYCVLAPKTGKFIDVNDNACALFKLSRERLLEMGPKELSPPTQADGRSTDDAVPEYIGEALAGRTPVFDWIHITGDGELFPWSYQAIANRYGAGKLERGVETVALASPEQAAELRMLLERLTPDEAKRLKIDKAMAGYDDPEDLPAEKAERALGFIRDYLRGTPAEEVA